MTTCELYLKYNFPKLEEIASRTAEENVRKFAEVFSKKLEQLSEKISVARFQSPEIQAALNDAVMACAKKGEKSHPELLSAILINGLLKENLEFVDLVLGEALNAVPRITKNHVFFLVLVHFIKSVRPEICTIDEYELIGKRLLPLVKEFKDISEVSISHLEYVGLLNYQRNLGGSVYDHLYTVLKCDASGTTVNELTSRFAAEAPTYNKLISIFTENNGLRCTLTSVGAGIAVSILRSEWEDLPYTIWISE